LLLKDAYILSKFKDKILHLVKQLGLRGRGTIYLRIWGHMSKSSKWDRDTIPQGQLLKGHKSSNRVNGDGGGAQ